MVDVVQLVEHRIVVPSVVGSSPIIHPKRKSPPREGFFFWGKYRGRCLLIHSCGLFSLYDFA